MTLIVKTKGNQPIEAKDKLWTEAKFQKLSRLIPAEAVVEIVMEDMYGPKRGQDKKIHVLAELPHAHEPFHLEETSTNFRQAASIASDRFKRYLNKYHDRLNHESDRQPRFSLAKIFERFRRPSTEE